MNSRVFLLWSLLLLTSGQIIPFCPLVKSIASKFYCCVYRYVCWEFFKYVFICVRISLRTKYINSQKCRKNVVSSLLFIVSVSLSLLHRSAAVDFVIAQLESRIHCTLFCKILLILFYVVLVFFFSVSK
jgi:hypothetical protein